MADDFRCPHCNAVVPPSALSCPACRQNLIASEGSTRFEPVPASRPEPVAILNRPDPEAKPPGRGKVLASLGVISLILIALVLYQGHIDRDRQLDAWLSELNQALANPNSGYWLQPQDNVTHGGIVQWIGSPSDLSAFKRIPLPRQFSPSKGATLATPGFLEPLRLNLPSSGDYYELQLQGPPFLFELRATYWRDFDGRELKTFEFHKISALTAWWAELTILFILAAAFAIDAFLTSRFRQAQNRAYQEYERFRTATVYQAQQKLEEARSFVERGEIAKSLVAVQEALNLLPEYGEAHELQRLIRNLASESGSLAAGDFAPPVSDSTDVVYLRVVGTPYAYRAASGATRVRVGRQRPRLGDASGPQNDLVIRVPASDDRTLRISRRHLEINRIGTEYFVVDHSGGNTKVAGQKLPPGRPAKISPGDRMVLADAVTLEFSVRSAGLEDNARIVRLGREIAGFNFEATLGDLLTEV